jgi:hypothetical protein
VEQGYFNPLNFIALNLMRTAFTLFTALSILNKYSATRVKRAGLTIPNDSYLFQALIGLILSDMSILRSISRSTGVLTRPIHTRLRFGQGWINVLFLWHVFTLLMPYCSAFPYSGEHLNPTTGNIDQRFFFNTMTLP